MISHSGIIISLSGTDLWLLSDLLGFVEVVALPRAVVFCAVLGDGASRLFIRACCSAWVWATFSRRLKACCPAVSCWPASLSDTEKTLRKLLGTWVNRCLHCVLPHFYFHWWWRWSDGTSVGAIMLGASRQNYWNCVFIKLQDLLYLCAIQVDLIQYVLGIFLVRVASVDICFDHCSLYFKSGL